MVGISIIIPVYNADKYLSRCLNSVLNQTFSDFEVLCIDDCSTDNSAFILREYANRDKRIRIFTNDVNLKAAGTRNIGLDNAHGRYIYFIDADDYIDNDYLQQMFEVAEKTKADIVMNTSIITETDTKISEYIHPSMPEIPIGGCYLDNAVAIDRSFCAIWMRLFKRDFIEKFSIRFQRVNMTEDNVFHYMTNVNASSIFVFQGTAFYHYILHDDSVTGVVKANNQRDFVTMRAYDIVYDYLVSKNLLINNRAKLFNVSGFFKVDTQEKYDLYKAYFSKINTFLSAHRDQYNEMDLFFSDIILSTSCFEEYKQKYPSSIALAFLKRRTNK